MKRTPMIIIILSCIAISIASVVLSHSNDNKSIPRITIIEPQTEITTYTSNEHTAPKTTARSAETYSAEISASTAETTSAADHEELYININTADLETLCRLEGIGEAIALEIIKYREENGGFNNIEEIMNVYRIGEKIFNRIRDNIYVDAPYYPEKNDENSDTPYEESPPNDEPEPVPNEPHLTLDDVAPIELNSADRELLMYLPYVDENIADKIIELRESIHGFSHVYELLYVDELTDKQVEEILQYVYIAE